MSHSFIDRLNDAHLQAECRARMGEAGERNSSILAESQSPMNVNVNEAKEENPHEPEEHSNVRNIVASLIKSIEENRYKADDTPTLLNIEQVGIFSSLYLHSFWIR